MEYSGTFRRLCLKVGRGLGDGDAGTQGREFGDVGRRDARYGTRGGDIGDVNKTYLCS